MQCNTACPLYPQKRTLPRFTRSPRRRALARGTATLRFAEPPSLAEALQLTLALTPTSEGQKTAQREIVAGLEAAFDARRQRIIISQSQVNLVKWLCLFVQAAGALFAIAMIHCDNRVASAITIGLFATGVAASVLLIAAHDRPFTGQISLDPGRSCRSCQRVVVKRRPAALLKRRCNERWRSSGNPRYPNASTAIPYKCIFL